MAKKTSYPSMKRFGVRYGKTVRDKYGAIEVQQRAAYPCPGCGYAKMYRVSVGIWECSKCGKKVASRAYQVETASRVEGV